MHIRMLSLMVVLLCGSAMRAAEAPSKDAVAGLIQTAQSYLLAKHQDDGSFYPHDQFKLGITAAILDALTSGDEYALSAEDPRAQSALDLLLSYQQPNGGIYDPQEGVANYVTSLTLIAMDSMGVDKPEVVAKAQQFLLGLQNMDEDSNNYGGVGYGSKGPGHEDLNNTSYAVEALRRSGMSADHPALQRALEFVERCQNHSATNDQPWSGNDGGGVYSPDVSKAGGSFQDEAAKEHGEAQREAGKLESYGTMTYSLISSYIYLGLSPEDPRLAAAYDWVRSHYVFDRNPGMPEAQARQGHYYYLLMMAKTFHQLDTTTLTLPDGSEVDWRADFVAAVQDMAQDAESGKWWVNEADRWAEGSPELVTAYMLKALKYIHATLE